MNWRQATARDMEAYDLSPRGPAAAVQRNGLEYHVELSTEIVAGRPRVVCTTPEGSWWIGVPESEFDLALLAALDLHAAGGRIG